MAAAAFPPSAPIASGAGRVRSIFLPGPAGKLEAILNAGTNEARCAALVCHPHPLGGGTMHNKVVYRAMKTLSSPALGSPSVLRFNFRGTGLSEGVHDGQLEWQDVAAAIDWLASEFQLPLLVAGFSFGAAMALQACCQYGAGAGRIAGIAALGLPTSGGTLRSAYTYTSLSGCATPKLFLSGDHDQFAPLNEWKQATDAAAEPKSLVLIPGADHFFTNHLEEMQNALLAWAMERL